MRKTIIILIFNCSLLITNCICQSITWQKIYRNPISNDAEGHDICMADGNNFYVVGFVAPVIPYCYVLKINPYGDTLWTRILNYGYKAFAVATSGDGGCVFTGDGQPIFTIKLNSDGEIVWSRNYNGTVGYDICNAADGGYILCGSLVSGFDFKGYVCKTDSNGYPLWEKDYFNGFTTDFFSIDEAVDGNGYVIVGQRNNSNGRQDAYFLKIDNNGDVLWERTYSVGVNFTYSKSFAKRNNGYIITGSASVFPSLDSSRVYTIKTDLSGNQKLTKIYQSNYHQSIANIVADNNNKFFVSFWTTTSNHRKDGSKIISIDTNFNIINKVTLLPDTNSLNIISLFKIPNSIDILGCGSNDQYQHGSLDLFAVRLDSSLNQPPPIGINPISGFVLSKTRILQNYPNPFNPSTNIQFELTYKAFVTIKIYDILGRELSTIINEKKEPGIYNIIYKATNVSSGIYIYSYTVNGILLKSLKFIVLK